MAFRIRYTEPAIAHLKEILACSWASFPETTEQFGKALLDHIDLLERFPYIGGKVPGRPGIRQLTHTPVIVDDRVREEPGIVEILQFRHSSRRR